MLVVFICGWRVFLHTLIMYFLLIMVSCFNQSLRYFFSINKYIYIYKQRLHVKKYEVLPSGAFYAKRIEIFLCDTSEIRTN